MLPDDNDAETARARGRIVWGIRALGSGLVVYALLVLYGLVAIFPRSAPTRDVIAGLKTIADDRTKTAAQLESLLVNARRANDTVAVRRLAVTAETAERVAESARARADTMERAALDPALVPSPLKLFGLVVTADLPTDWRFLILAMLAGAMGAFLHVAQSFATYVGNRSFGWSWTWWYLLRPFIGAVLAVVVYVVFRSALVPGSSANVTNAYGVVALAALAGMFSKQAIDKLNEIFTVAFRSAPGQGDAERMDKATDSSPAPVISGIEPVQPAAANGSVAFTVRGTGFSPAAVVYLDDVGMTTKAVDATRLDATVAVRDLPGGGPFKLTIRTPPKAGGPATDHGSVAGPLAVTIGV
jgi:uncharacterized membrane protein YeaQ/YmgE (transglycosylase-associated protein family)